jgi:hypothetical protein
LNPASHTILTIPKRLAPTGDRSLGGFCQCGTSITGIRRAIVKPLMA